MAKSNQKTNQRKEINQSNPTPTKKNEVTFEFITKSESVQHDEDLKIKIQKIPNGFRFEGSARCN